MKIKSTANTYATSTHSDVDAYEMEDGRTINLSGWSGEMWGECWNDDNDNDCGRDARPIYKFQALGVDYESMDEEEANEIVGIEF